MAKILIEIDDNLKQRFSVKLAELSLTQKEVLTECIENFVNTDKQEVGTTTTGSEVK